LNHTVLCVLIQCMTSSLLNIAAIILSLAAVAISSYFAIRQSLAAKQANQIPVFIDLFKDARNPEFRDRERSLWQDLNEHDPSLGFEGLPKGQRHDAEIVCSYYSTLAYCVTIGIAEHDLAVIPVYYRMLKTWEAVYPFVVAERKIRNDGGSFLTLLEDFVAEAKLTDIHSLEKEASRRAFPRLHKLTEKTIR
jgi:hypothetical protein